MINKFLLSVTPAAPTGGNKLYTWGGGVTSNSGTTAALGLGNSTRASSPTQVGSENWSAIAAGASHTIAIKSDGTLWSWGYNGYGELAYDDKTSWAMIASGNNHSIAIKSDGTLWAWGRSNSAGQMGTGNVVSSLSPVQIGTENSWVKIKSANDTSYAIRSDGALFSWGSNAGSANLLGDGTTANRSSPVQLGTSSWSMISASNTHVMAIRSDGTLWGWGSNAYGQLGLQNTDTTSWIMVSASRSFDYTMAIRSDGTLWGWGVNTAGQLGDGTTINRSSPVQIGTSSWTMIACGIASLAIRADGTLWSWGAPNNGVLGDSTTVSRSSPVQIGIGNSWTQVTCGNSHVMAIRSDGTLWTWGLNNNGQLGDGTTITRSSPVQIGTGNSWTQVSGGNVYSFAIYTDATNPLSPITTLWAWGFNNIGQLGINSTINRSSPVQIGSTSESWSKVSAGGSTTSALRANGTLWSWGANTYGALGDNTTVGQRSSPVQVGSATDWVDISCFGVTASYAIKSDGTLWGWGQNTDGQLGVGTTTARSSPVQIGVGLSWSKINTGFATAFGITTTGELYGAGDGANFKLGQPALVTSVVEVTRFLKHMSITQSSYSTPVQIAADKSWSYVDCTSGHHAVAVASDGSLWAWGTTLALGNNDYGVIPSPTKIGNSSWTKVAVGSQTVGYSQSYAIRSDGTLWAWGYNSTSGSLGINLSGSTTFRSSPVQIGASNTWSDVFGTSVGFYYAITTSGMLYGWGENAGTAANYSGDGTQAVKSSPVQIGTSSWTMVSAGRLSSNSPFVQGVTATGAGYFWGVATTNSGTADGGSIPEQYLTPQKFFSYMSLSSPVQIGTSSWSKVAAGLNYSAAIRVDGALFTWGRNTSGGLGNNSIQTVASPVQIGTSSWTMVACGYSAGVTSAGGTTGAIRSDGALFMWGGNANGQLGDGTTVSKSSPVQIGTSSWTMVSCGMSHIIAIRSDGGLFSWGGPGSGLYLGDGSTIARSSPVQLGTSSWTMVSTSLFSQQTAAIRSDGTLWTWGSNSLGQVGDGTTVNKTSPVQIGTSSWSVVSSGLSHMAGIRSDGTLWTWGGNTNWQLGSGSTIARSSPVQLGTSTSWVAVSAGLLHNAALLKQ